MNIQPWELESLYRSGAGEETYWQSDARAGSNKLLIRLRAEFDHSMYPPQGWKKREPVAEQPKSPPRRQRKLNSIHHLNRIRPLQEMVADHFNVTADDLCGPSRIAIHVRPRMIAIYIAKTFTNLSFPKIGSFFGGRDHTTILHSYRKIQHEMLVDADLAFDIAFLVEQFTGEQQ